MGDDEPREKSLTSSGSEVDAAGKSDESNTINGCGNEIPENWLGRFAFASRNRKFEWKIKVRIFAFACVSTIFMFAELYICKTFCRLAVDTRFQQAFMQLLNAAQFEELSVRDLMLTSALNTDYLLTLPVYVDWKKASESNAIIFR